MGRTNSLPLRNFSESFNNLDVVLYVLGPTNASAATALIHRIRVSNLFRETLVSETGVVLVKVCARFDLPGEETPTKRSVGHDCDPEVFGRGDD